MSSPLYLSLGALLSAASLTPFLATASLAPAVSVAAPPFSRPAARLLRTLQLISVRRSLLSIGLGVPLQLWMESELANHYVVVVRSALFSWRKLYD